MRSGLQTTSIAACLATAIMNAGAGVHAQATSPAMLVTVHVTATDRAGRDVADLRAEDISIRANGKPAAPVSLSRSSKEISAVVLVDTSASLMAQHKKMADLVSEFLSHLRPQDRAVVGGFSERVQVSRAFTSNRNEHLAQFKSLQVGNPTRFFDAMVASADALKDVPARHVVFVMTDGEDTASKANFNTALQDIQTHDVMVYGVGLEAVFTVDGRTVRKRPDSALKRLVEETGGGYLELKDDVDTTAAIARVFDELHNQYVLTFVPPMLDGKLRKLQIATTRSEVSLRARRGYVAGR